MYMSGVARGIRFEAAVELAVMSPAFSPRCLDGKLSSAVSRIATTLTLRSHRSRNTCLSAIALGQVIKTIIETTSVIYIAIYISPQISVTY